LKNWTIAAADEETFDNGKGEIFIRRGTFFSDVGEITGIAFLVFLGVSFNLSKCCYNFIFINSTELFSWRCPKTNNWSHFNNTSTDINSQPPRTFRMLQTLSTNRNPSESCVEFQQIQRR
jgi:hypothetical protein